MIEIINKSKSMKVFNLPHDEYCAKLGKCSCTIKKLQRLVMDAAGDKHIRVEQKRIPDSLRIPSGQTIKGPKELLWVKAIKKALDNGEIKIKRIETQTQPPPKVSETKKKVSEPEDKKKSKKSKTETKASDK